MPSPIPEASKPVSAKTPGASEDPTRQADAAGPGTARILIVEDDEAAQLLARRAVDDLAGDVRVAPTMEEARHELENEDFDLVLLDLILPDGDGRQLLTEMRERPRSAQTQVVVLSGKTGSNTKLECFRLGADEFFEKPFDPEVLEAAVGRQLERVRERTAEGRVDALTGLPNRAALIKRFPELLAVSERNESPLAVALVEMGGLGRLRREEGRERTDRIQAAFAKVLSSHTGDPDVVGRWEDAAFVVLMPATSPADAAEPISEALDDFRSEPGIPSPGIELPASVTFVAGVVDGRRFDDLREAVQEAERSLVWTGPGNEDEVVVHPTDSAEEPREGFRVLLVEDDEVIAHLVQHRLQRSGMEVVHLDSGAAARDLIEEASTSDFDIALLDVKLPGADGFELLQILKDRPGWTDVPVIMVTSMGQESDVVRAFELGADDYVLKPLSPRELLARIHRLLRRS